MQGRWFLEEICTYAENTQKVLVPIMNKFMKMVNNS